jgi:hypothetical protein
MTTIAIERAVNTTLNIIRSHKPCADGWQKLLTGLNKTQADDEPLPLTRILEVNGLDDVLWVLRCVDDQRALRLYAVACAREVQHLMDDPRSIAALDVAERHAHGQATDSELTAAWYDAAWAAWATRDAERAARIAACAAEDAASAARDAERAARIAASAALRAVADAAWAAAEDVARAAAWDAARDAMRVRQTELFVQFFGGES